MFVAAAGALGLIAVRHRPPMVWTASTRTLDRWLATVSAVSTLDPLISDGTATGAIRTPPGVMRSIPRSSRRGHLAVTVVRACFRPLREVQYHRKSNASWPRRKLLRLARWSANPIPNFRISVASSGFEAGVRRKCFRISANIFERRRHRVPARSLTMAGVGGAGNAR